MATLSATVTEDTFGYENSVDSNYDTFLDISGESGTTRRRHTFVIFDTTSIPTASTVLTAVLTFKIYANGIGSSAEGETVKAYKLTKAFVEEQATWSNYSTGNAWDNAGGDYVTSNPAGGSATMPSNDPSNIQSLEFSDVTAIVADAVAAGIATRFLIRFGNESIASPSRVNFLDKEVPSFVETLEITYTVSPTVTTQTCESVVGLTATGRGNITDLGGENATAHGHAIGTSLNPTVDGSEFDNGAASTTGPFTTPMTNLTPGTGYYTRAFAVNSAGTSYGDNVYFVAPKTGTMGRAGFTWWESSNLRGFDENAIEQEILNKSDVDDSPVNGATTDPISSNWAYDHLNDEDVHDAVQVNASELDTATYDDVQDYMNFFGDRTILSGGAITDNGDGTAAIASLTGWCKETDSDTAIARFFNYGGGNTPALTDMARNYVYIDYNGGTVQIVAATALLTHGQKFDHVLIGTIFRNGTILHWHQHHNIGIERVNTVDLYELESHVAERVDGMVTSDAGSRKLSISAGVLYEGIDRETTSPFDTPNSGTADATEANKLHDADGGFASTDVGKPVHNTTDDTYAIVTAFVNSGELTLDADIFISGENYDLDIFSYWWTGDSGSTWTEVRGSTLISNSQYNNIAAGLANLTANRYGVHWVYMDLDGSNLHVVYGQGNYTANQAEEASVPSVLPPNVSEYSVLIAKIILQKDQTAMIITLPWTTVFTSTLATDHGSLGGLGDEADHTYAVLIDGTRAMSELRLTPKVSSSGAEGTIFYDSDDDHIWVATEA